MAAAGVFAIIWAVLASRGPVKELWTGGGFLGTAPGVPKKFVARRDLAREIVGALRKRPRAIALTGLGGAGKSTLAAIAITDRRTRWWFRNGVTWLEAGPTKDPLALMADLARRLGVEHAQPGFVTLAEGRDVLAVALRRKRVLIAVDNVWERGPLNALLGLAPECTVIFTTRKKELAEVVDALQVKVDELTQDQALRLLGKWTSRTPAALPTEARALCTRVGNLALGISMVGAMVSRGRSFADVLALVEQDLGQVVADLDPQYQYRTLLAAIEAGITGLTESDQELYEQLTVFAGRGAFSRESAEALWQSKVSQAAAGNLLAEFTGRSLLMPAGEGWYAAHDLQYDVLAKRLGPDKLAAAHARLLDGFRVHYPSGWASSAGDVYLGNTLVGHLRDAGLGDELRAVLTDPEWIQARLIQGGLPDLIADYANFDDPLAQQIVRGLRLSAPVLTADPQQLRSQLVGRLLSHPDPASAAWATELTERRGSRPCLVPVTPPFRLVTTSHEQTLGGHDGPVRSVAITADGTRAITSGGDGKVRIWDLTTGAQGQELVGHHGPLRSVAITADGTRAITSGGDGKVRIWDLTTGAQLRELARRADPAWSVAITADGTRAITSGADGKLRVWDPTTGAQLRELKGHSKSRWWVPVVAITADGKRAITSGGDRKVRVWDLTTGTNHEFTSSGRYRGDLLTISADGARAITKDDRDGEVWVWDLTTGTQHHLTGSVRSVAMTPDGTRAITGGPTTMGGDESIVRVWDLTTRTQLRELTSHGDRVESVAISADGLRAITGGQDGKMRVWDLTTGTQQPQSASGASVVHSVASTPDGCCAITGEDGTLRVWEPTTGTQQREFSTYGRGVYELAISSDGTRAFICEGGEVRVWDLTSGISHALSSYIGLVHSVAVTSDGTCGITGGGDGRLRVWDLTTGTQQQELTSDAYSVLAVAITPDGTRAITGGPAATDLEDGVVQVWDLSAGIPQQELFIHAGRVESVAITPDGTRAITGPVTRVWDLTTGKLHRELSGPARSAYSVALSPDGTRAITGGYNGILRVWDVESGTEIARWDGDYFIVGCMALLGPPLKIVVGQRYGDPYVLEFQDQQCTD